MNKSIDIIRHLRPTDNELVAILDHVLRTERRELEILRGGNRMIDQQDLDAIREAMTVYAVDDAVYRYLVFYNLLNLMNLDTLHQGWANIRGMYDLANIGLRGIVDRESLDKTLRREQTSYLQRLANNASDAVAGFPLRIIHASMIHRILTRYPLWNGIQRFIEETMNQEGLRYQESMSYYKTDLLEEDRYPTKFYNSISDVPLIEQLIVMRNFAGGGVYGTTFRVQFAESIEMFGKYDSVDPYNTIHEYRIGKELNLLYDRCPFMMYTYGLINVYVDHQFLNDYAAVLDNRSPYDIDTREPTSIVLAQWLTRSRSLENFISNYPGTIEYTSTGEISEVPRSEAIRRVLTAILCTVRYLWDEIGYVHGDLHLNNVQVMLLDQPQILNIPGTDLIFNLNAIPVLIDYGFSTILRPRGTDIPIIPIVPESVMTPLDARLSTDQRYVFDVVRFLNLMLSGTEAIADDELYNDLISMHFTTITGESFEELPSDVRESIISHITKTFDVPSKNYEKTINRFPPLQSTLFNPNSAIDIFSSKMQVPPIGTPTNEVNRRVMDMISREYREKGTVTIDTYSGSLMYRQYLSAMRRHRIEPVYLIGPIIRGIDNLNILLINEYRFMMQKVSDETEAKVAQLQRLYRSDINNIIQSASI